LLVVSSLCLTSPVLVFAKPPRGQGAKKSGGDELRVEDLVGQAKKRYEQGEFAIAAELYMKAYALDKRPAFIFNAARAHEKAGKKGEAVALFKLYLSVSDDALGKAEAEAHIKTLEGEPEAAKPDPAPRPADPPPTVADAKPRPPDPGPTVLREKPSEPKPVDTTLTARPKRPGSGGPPKWAGALVLSAGAVSAITGVVFWAAAAGRETDLKGNLGRTDAESGLVVGISQRDATTENDLIGSRKTLGAVFGGIGALGILAGGILLLTSHSGTEGQLTVVPTPQGAALFARF